MGGWPSRALNHNALLSAYPISKKINDFTLELATASSTVRICLEILSVYFFYHTWVCTAHELKISVFEQKLLFTIDGAFFGVGVGHFAAQYCFICLFICFQLNVFLLIVM